MRKLPSSPKLSPMDFEPELVSTLKSVLHAAVDQIDVANRTPATKRRWLKEYSGQHLMA